MNVKEALNARHSFRAFLPEPIERATLDAIFAAAQRTPSWANSQPWEVFVATGESLKAIRDGFAKKFEEGSKPDPETAFPKEWTEDAKRRQQQLGPDMKRDCGDATQQFMELNRTFFGAPAVVFICIDRRLSHWSLYDAGAYSQSLLLAAIEEGVGGIQAAQAVLFPDVIHQALDIPDKLQITIGIPIGYVDRGNPINNFNSSRDPVGQVVHIRG